MGAIHALAVALRQKRSWLSPRPVRAGRSGPWCCRTSRRLGSSIPTIRCPTRVRTFGTARSLRIRGRGRPRERAARPYTLGAGSGPDRQARPVGQGSGRYVPRREVQDNGEAAEGGDARVIGGVEAVGSVQLPIRACSGVEIHRTWIGNLVDFHRRGVGCGARVAPAGSVEICTRVPGAAGDDRGGVAPADPAGQVVVDAALGGGGLAPLKLSPINRPARALPARQTTRSATAKTTKLKYLRDMTGFSKE